MNKKSIITALLALVWVVGQGQTFTPIVEDSIDFVITGTTTVKTDSVVWFLVAPYRQCLVPRVPVEDGHFRISGRLPRNTFLQIGDFAENDLHFIVSDEPTHINLVTGEVSGSEVQQRFIRCQMRERDIDRVAEPWWDSLSDEEKERIHAMSQHGLTDATAKDSANFQKYESFMADRDAVARQNIRENKDNIIPAYYLYVHHAELNYEQKREFMREDAAYAHHPAMERPWKAYWGMLQQMNITGKPAPDFEAEAPDGTMHRLSEYAGHGQYVLIDFWASWCGPCIGSFPFMKELYATYKDRGLVFLGVSCDKNRDAWQKALEKHQLPWTALRSPSRKGDACDLYGITGIPAVILISPDGKVVSTDLEGKELKAKLAEIFGE